MFPGRRGCKPVTLLSFRNSRQIGTGKRRSVWHSGIRVAH